MADETTLPLPPLPPLSPLPSLNGLPATPVPNLGEQLLDDFLTTGCALDPAKVPLMAQQYTQALGIGAGTVYLADLPQGRLRPITGDAELPIDGTLAGSALLTGAVQTTEADAQGTVFAWFPLLHGEERLGVFGVRTAALDRTGLRRCQLVAALLAMVLAAGRDTLALPAELLRALLPPGTVYNSQVLSTAVLEPAQELGGDAFEHSVAAEVLHAAVLDAMGHDLTAGLTAAVALAACRNARRNGAELPELVRTTDLALTRWFPDRFATGVFLRLDLPSGLLHWSNCGHPPPLLIRRQQLVADALSRPAEPPLGVTGLTELTRAVHAISLDPGDRLLIHTDGVVEAAGAGRSRFGEDRLAESVIRATADGAAPAQALRALVGELLTHRGGPLADDATIMLVEWQPAAFRTAATTAFGGARRFERSTR
ncbi:PP2C family protein-serine/threonine phosphatase [Kitasatospora azatica]|uniref:PP2C family protein-serine/threonine phosphatase n=1 Tax=Kitasatospora azatica TaxID=58347 RepID=UPI000A078ED8|nr:PP2C family protein-serine/threonine phosphatase [Kitasatospora azatica]